MIADRLEGRKFEAPAHSQKCVATSSLLAITLPGGRLSEMHEAGSRLLSIYREYGALPEWLAVNEAFASELEESRSTPSERELGVMRQTVVSLPS